MPSKPVFLGRNVFPILVEILGFSVWVGKQSFNNDQDSTKCLVMSSVLYTQGWKNPVFIFGKLNLTGDRQRVAKLSKQKMKDTKLDIVWDILILKDYLWFIRNSNLTRCHVLYLVTLGRYKNSPHSTKRWWLMVVHTKLHRHTREETLFLSEIAKQRQKWTNIEGLWQKGEWVTISFCYQ